MSAEDLLKCREFANARQYHALNLAYMGDAVYELLVRSRLLAEGNRTVNRLNRLAAAQVRASAQSANYYRIYDLLSEDELAVLKRGRNANPATRAKNATVADYRNATGLEALFGYLYLNGEILRLIELFDKCYEVDENGK